MVSEEQNELYEQDKADQEFEDSLVTDTPLKKAMEDAGMKESDFK
jgi:hypothetical protein